jgi:hypothetical protein
MAVEVPWEDGKEEDFSDLHEAVNEGRTQRFENQQSFGSDSESEDEEEPSPDDKGIKLFEKHIDTLQDPGVTVSQL